MSQISQVINIKPFKASGIWLPVLFVLLSGGLLVAMIFAVLLYQLLYLDRVYPGVLVDGGPVGGMAPPEIVAAIHARAERHLSRPITIKAGQESWTFTGQELGMHIDAVATANKAYAMGRQGNFLADILTQLSLMSTPRNIEPVIRYDTGPINEKLQELADKIDQPPQNAQLIIHPNAKVEVIPAQRGRRLHLDATRGLIEEAIFNPDNRPVTAVVQQVIPAITEADIEVARQQAENLLSQPLVFSFSTDSDAAEWQLEPATLVELMAVVKAPDQNGRPQLALKLKPEKFAPYFEEFAAAINLDPTDARFEFDPDRGQLTILQDSREGRMLDVAAAYQQLELLSETLKTRPVPRVELPVILRPPLVSSKDIDRLGIKALVSESTSYFKGSSEGRMNNIALSASKFHGVVIPPHEIFSFNKYLGEITRENGFDDSLIIFGDRTTVGVGGGVCQVSTTAFRAAFFGGFEIIERWAHGYRVGWYETKLGPGLDATIYTPDVDFKFRNDTDHHLLIQTRTDLEAGTVTFEFYGTPTGREVIVGEPEVTNVVRHGPPIKEEDPTLPKGVVKQVDWAQDGMDVTVTRTVKQGEVVLYEDVITSHYKPWQAIYKIGTAE